MKNVYYLILTGWLLLYTIPTWGTETSGGKVLERLDEVITRKAEYRAEREKTIGQLKQRLAHTSDNTEKYDLCGELFGLYLHYQADSALLYVEKKNFYLPLPGQKRKGHEIAINRAEVMGVMGMYNEALHELRSIKVEELALEDKQYYYNTLRTCYGWLADYTAEAKAKKHYQELTGIYRDSALAITPSGVGYRLILAEQALLKHQPDSAIPTLNKMLGSSLDMRQKAYVNYTLAAAYEAKGETDMQTFYLAQTAILDLTMSVREYASLQKLARLMYKQGDLERAYRYLSCSMEDAVACNARLRFLEVTEFYPIIDRAYSENVKREKRIGWILLGCVSVLTVLLVVLALYLYTGMKKLSVMRHNLSVANKELRSVNLTLAQTGKIKEMYIARYLDRCVSYLDKLEQYRRSLEKLAMASRLEELFKTIRSEQFLRDERKKFYHEFDKSFLELFPNFIHDFNELLIAEGQVFPKSGELLNTELRIFALIRLGITDTTSIAHFLSYSLATVYNYRSRIRNRAKGDKELFEQEVMRL